jgi:hypothetical protein
MEEIQEDKKAFLMDEFNALNQQTMSYASKSLSSDIRRTMKNRERFETFLKENKLIVSILMLPLLQPIASYFISEYLAIVFPLR